MSNFNRSIIATIASAALSSTVAFAQNQQPASPAPLPSGATAAAPSSQTPADQLLKPEQLQQLVAPIALYPDNLLAQVMMASTYPLEVVEASRWVTKNKNLKGDQLRNAVDKEKWDDSVKGLVATPQVLDMMSNKLSWTKDLGDAFLAQQADVMDAVQALRARAQSNKKLESTKEQKVTTKTEENKRVIVIEPAAPNTVYVPYYDPGVVYGSWPYPAYPPYYWGPPYGYPYYGAGVAFVAGVALGAWAGRYWGGGWGWGNGSININNNFNRVTHWNHNPAHRQGVRYNNSNVAKQFGRGNQIAGGAGNRNDFRGRGDGGRPGGDRPGAGNRPAGGDRPGAGNRPGGGDRPGAGNRPGGGGNAGNRPGGGDRPGAGGGNRPSAGGGQRPSTRPSGGGGRDSAFAGGGGRAAVSQSARGHTSMGGRGGASFHGGGGGGFRGGGGGGGGRGGGGGGRRSDLALKHDITLLGQLDSGIGFYRFSYNGSAKSYVGVIAQEVQSVAPQAVWRGGDGYLRVRYEKIGVKFQSYVHWFGTGALVPHGLRAN